MKQPRAAEGSRRLSPYERRVGSEDVAVSKSRGIDLCPNRIGPYFGPKHLLNNEQRSNRRRPLPCNGTGSRFSDLCRKAEVCNQKAEVGEGAGEGAETLPTVFFNDLECFC